MALETGSYIADLVAANPDGSVDPVSQGDDHLRLIKTVVKATFPNMGGVFKRVQLKTAGYTVATTDNQTVLRFTGAGGYTLALPAVSGLYSGFGVIVVNDTSGTIIIDPNGAETINGAATLTLPAGARAGVYCDGSAFYGAIQLPTDSSGNPNIGAATGTSLALTGGTVTASTPIVDGTQTWNSSGVTFTGWKMNITDSASAAGSLLADLQVGGASKFSASKAGAVVAASSVTGTALIPSGSSVPTNGLYLPAANTPAIASNGVLRLSADANGVNFYGAASAYAVQAIAADAASSQAAIFTTTSSSSSTTVDIWNKNTSGDNRFLQFFTESAATLRGSITYNRGGGVTAYNTTSDYRAKTVYGPLVDTGATIDALKVYRGKMHDATIERPMLIAHEAQEVVPYAVNGQKDELNEDGTPKYQTMDHQILVPLLIAEIQALRARVAVLEGSK